MRALRDAFVAQQPTLDPERLIFLDESGMRLGTPCRYGWAQRGQKAFGKAVHGAWKMVTMLGAVGLDGFREMVSIAAATASSKRSRVSVACRRTNSSSFDHLDSGGALTTLSNSIGASPHCVRGNDGHVFFTTQSQFTQIDVGNGIPITTDKPYANGDVYTTSTAAARAYFAQGGDLYTVAFGSQNAIKIASAAPEQPIRGLDADDTGFVFTWDNTGGGTATIAACSDPLCASGVVTLQSDAGADPDPNPFVVSPQAVFFFSNADGHLYRLAR